MKICKLFIPLFLLNIFYSCSTNPERRATASVEKVNNIYVFIKSKPASQYDFIGAIELKWYDKLTQLDQQNLESTIRNLTGILSFSDNLVNTINEIKQKYPTADAVLFDDDMSRCEAVRFK